MGSYYDSDLDMLGSVELLGQDEVELLGEDPELLLGEDEYDDYDDDVVGARRRYRPRRSRRSSAMARRAMMARAAQQGTIVRQKAPTEARTLILPVTAGAATAAGGTTTITVQASQPFRASAFLVDPVIAPNFTINSIQVGRQNQFVGAGSVPATAFSALNPLATVAFDTGQTSEQIQVSVTNVSGAASTFRAGFWGKTIN